MRRALQQLEEGYNVDTLMETCRALLVRDSDKDAQLLRGVLDQLTNHTFALQEAAVSAVMEWVEKSRWDQWHHD